MEETQKLPAFSRTAPYAIPLEYYRTGFTAFQKKFIMRRNYIMMAIFAVLLISFVAAGIKDPTNKMAYFLMLLCLTAIFMLWYMPRKQRRIILDTVKELEGQQYTAECDGNVLRLWTQQNEEDTEVIPESRVLLETAWIQSYEEFYLICDGKRMFYILPKAAIDTASVPPEQLETTETASPESE
ncbi:hypothetical protein [uncultured Ruminococcus sp.]|uniref:hypothetical protein n=1 Tax=uncultured Ruminococcus sp. TaxID=165186 RepID=UPI00262470D3|nr:hypothetical protein [uncultured Ruminococcus sp.]